MYFNWILKTPKWLLFSFIKAFNFYLTIMAVEFEHVLVAYIEVLS